MAPPGWARTQTISGGQGVGDCGWIISSLHPYSPLGETCRRRQGCKRLAIGNAITKTSDKSREMVQSHHEYRCTASDQKWNSFSDLLRAIIFDDHGGPLQCIDFGQLGFLWLYEMIALLLLFIIILRSLLEKDNTSAGRPCFVSTCWLLYNSEGLSWPLGSLDCNVMKYFWIILNEEYPGN